MYLTLSDVEICKVGRKKCCIFEIAHGKILQAKEENLKKMMKEYGDLESDLKVLQSICKY